MHDELLDGVLDGQAAVVGRRLPGQLAAVAVDVGHQQPVLRCRRSTHNRQHDLSAGKVTRSLRFSGIIEKNLPQPFLMVLFRPLRQEWGSKGPAPLVRELRHNIRLG